MKRLSILVLVAALTMSMVAGCVREVKTYSDPEQVINIGVNGEFVISLKAANDSQWGPIEYDATMLKLVDFETEWHGRDAIQRLRFKALEKEVVTV